MASEEFIGTHLGSYEITALLGKGGMGEVYRARDSRLKREVAIKILPPEFSDDPDRVSRFQREAEVLASLNHANIAAIHDLQEANDQRFLVLELVEGDTLADHLHRGPIPLDEALRIASLICEALEAAHESGVVHRDLKPANVKVTPDGRVKVLDFGLAKAFQSQTPTTLSSSPTRLDASAPGLILGTPAFMSPEQAKGREADHTWDVWAFGCVLYEMLSGHAAFEGGTTSEILAAVLMTEPDWTRLPSETPSAVRRLLRRCLHKDRKQRLQHIGDARIEINEVRHDPGSEGVAQATPRPKPLAWMVVAAVLAVLTAFFAIRSTRPAIPASELRLEITTPATSDPVSLAISPDGQNVVFVAMSDGRRRLWLRPLNAVSARPLAGTDGGLYPFWSPDNRSLGFFADGKLQRIDLDGGLVRTLANAPNPLGASWSLDDTILFVPNYTGPIFRTSSTGGEARALTQIEAKQSSHRFPRFLPGGRHFFYYATGSPEVSGVYVGEIDGTSQRVLEADGPAVYALPGHLLFVRQGTLFAQEFDPIALALSGTPFSVAEQIAVGGETNAVGLSTSAAGPFIYRAGLAAVERQLVSFDRSGKEIRRLGARDSANPSFQSMSPDGLRVAMSRTVNGNTDLWMLDLGRDLLSRFTFDASAEGATIWSPDGDRIVFNSERQGPYDLYEKSATGSGSERLLLATPLNKMPLDWSPDGRFVLYRSPSPATGFDLWALPMDGERKPFPVVQTEFEERDGEFSPDGKWIAYQSNESGRVEVLVQAFPGPGARLQVSRDGGAQVRWGPDGRELFYIALDGRLMAVPLRFASSGPPIEAGTPVPLFATRVGGAVQGPNRQQYTVSRDGQQFLMNTLTEAESPSPITVILNWNPKP